MIEYFGVVDIPTGVIYNADTIKLEHYKVNSPSKFQVRSLCDATLIASISANIQIPKEKLDYVYFSVCRGAEPHIDLLDPKKFTDTTFVIPIILPQGDSIIRSEDHSVKVHVGGVYKFDHTKTHSMELDDTVSGAVVVMVAVLH